jgi:hypothetical protein
MSSSLLLCMMPWVAATSTVCFFFFFFFIDTIDDSLVVTTNGRYTERTLFNGVSSSTRDYSNDTQQCPRCVIHIYIYT